MALDGFSSAGGGGKLDVLTVSSSSETPSSTDTSAKPMAYFEVDE
jgi:hypothetical protein